MSDTGKIIAGESCGNSKKIAAGADRENVKKIATRESYGNALCELGVEHDDIVVLDADLAAATKTGIFKKAFPERFIDCGIAEADMIGVAAGLATCGLVPFASSFAMFAAGRAYEQVRNSVAYPHLNVKIGATHAGISVGEDGATHQCCEDLALMRAIPGMTVICPSDDIEARAAVRAAYEMDGPVYMRFGRLAVPVINDNPNYSFKIGKGVVLKTADGARAVGNRASADDLAIIATGLCVAPALEAAERLEKEGINARVINIHTIKPIDKELILKAAAETGRIVTVEEHSIIGGLGSAVCECVGEGCCNAVNGCDAGKSARVENGCVGAVSADETKKAGGKTGGISCRIKRIGINDVFGKSGPAAELLKEFGLDADGIYEGVKEFIR